MDDVLVHGSTRNQHDDRLRQVLERLGKAGITLNEDKCEFGVQETTFLGHVIDCRGIRADPEKTKAIIEFPTPSSKKDLRRFFGIVNYLGKFSPKLSESTSHLRKLLGNDSEWIWGHKQVEQFQLVKELLAKTPILTPYSVTAETMISADSSSFGLGAALLQRVNGDWKPVAYASRSLTPTEKRYAQIEKEALAICWACSKFSFYITGKDITVETDHKPLLAILGTKELAKLPIRVQRFRLKMMSYSYKVIYTPGNKLVLADALSRSPNMNGGEVMEMVEPLGVSERLDELPIAHGRLNRIKASTLEDEAGRLVLEFITNGWPNSRDVPQVVKNVYTFRDYLTQVDGVIFFMSRVFVPELERERVLRDIHTGHQGENKCIRRASDVVWWPGMTKDIKNMVSCCAMCEKYRHKSREPLICTPLPERPWWRLAMDLFEMNHKSYLIVIDYFSRFITVDELDDSTDAQTICTKVKDLFCLLGVPNTILTDNGPQFVSDKFKNLLRRWDVQHVTSSPRNPQSNGEVERAVRTVKGLMHKNVDIQAALAMYRDTPLANGYSPSQLLNGRSMNSMGILSEQKIDVKRLRKFEDDQRHKQATWYNSRHAARPRSPIGIQQQVVIREKGKSPTPATVIGTRGREIVAVGSSGNLLRRNRAIVSRSPIEKDLEDSSGIPNSESLSSPRIDIRTYRASNESVTQDSAESALRTPPFQSPVVAKPVEHSMLSGDNRSSKTPERRTRCGRQVKKPNRLNL